MADRGSGKVSRLILGLLLAGMPSWPPSPQQRRHLDRQPWRIKHDLPGASEGEGDDAVVAAAKMLDAPLDGIDQQNVTDSRQGQIVPNLPLIIPAQVQLKRIRGSSNAYSRSTIRLTTMKITAINSTSP
jgi:hypothetical protein